MLIRSQDPPLADKVQRLFRKEVRRIMRWKRLAPKALCYGDDIVHAVEKSMDKCNQWVVGPSPTRGAMNHSCNNEWFLF